MEEKNEDTDLFEVTGASGACYQAEDTPVFLSAAGESLYTVVGGKSAAVLLFPEDCLSAEHEVRATRMLERNASLYGKVKAQISCPLELLYKDGRFAGLLVSFMPGGTSLLGLLEHGSADNAFRTRVACNLCAVVLLAGRVGASLGRIDPGRVFVDESTCRVFLVPGILSALMSDAYGDGEVQGIQTGAASDEPMDIAFHVYALMHGRQCAALERDLWAGARFRGSGPAPALMASTLLESLRKPFFIKLLDRLLSTDAFEGPFWADPPALRRLYERGFCSNGPKLSFQVALDFYETMERPRGAAVGRLTLLLERIKRFASAGGISRDEVKHNERKIFGSRSTTQPSVFWLTTLGCSAAVGLFATLNGFTPLDLVANPSTNPRLPESPNEVMWQFVPAAVAGSVVFNLALAKRNRFVGYGRSTYCWSVLMGVAFMFITHLAFGG